MLARSLSLLRIAVDDLVLVIGATDDPAAFQVAFPDARVRVASASAEGMGASLAAGIAAEARWGGCLVALADKPFVREATLLAVREALATQAIVVPCCDGEWGHPVGFPHRVFPELLRCSGDSGARSVLLTHRSELLLLETGDPGVVADIDTPDDLLRYAQRFS